MNETEIDVIFYDEIKELKDERLRDDIMRLVKNGTLSLVKVKV